MDAKPWKAGDPCPACDGDLKPAPVVSDTQLAKALDRENPITLKRGTDTMPSDERAEHGVLYRCTNALCRYAARVLLDKAKRRIEG